MRLPGIVPPCGALLVNHAQLRSPTDIPLGPTGSWLKSREPTVFDIVRHGSKSINDPRVGGVTEGRFMIHRGLYA